MSASLALVSVLGRLGTVFVGCLLGRPKIIRWRQLPNQASVFAKNIMSAVRYLGTKHHSWEEQQDEQIVLVQGGMVHLSRCARAMWIHSVCLCSCVLQPISLMGSGRRCNTIGQSSATHFVFGREQKRTRPLSLVESSLKAEIMLSTTSRVSVRWRLCQDSEDTWMNKWLLIEFVALFGLNVADITLKTCCPSVAFAVGLF